MTLSRIRESFTIAAASVSRSGAQRRDTGNSTVAALMQRNTGGIEHYRGNIVQNEKFDLIFHAALLEPLDAVGFFQSLDARLFDDLLTVGQAVQLAFD